MEKDIDDLLDEVETKFVKKSQAQSSKSSIGAGQTKTKDKPANTSLCKPKTVSKQSNALDDVIDDILDMDVAEGNDVNESHSKEYTRSMSNDASKSEQSRRCFPVFLGGSSSSLGRGSTVNNRACDQLRCTSCDFKVCSFDNLSWSKDTDYLFLRNNVPDFQKLKSKLLRKKGCRAYCCQCSWRNIQELAQLTDSDLKWVCGKHPS